MTDTAKHSERRPCRRCADQRPLHHHDAGAARRRARTLSAVMHADMRVLDPIWTTANITAYHGG